MAVKKPTTQVQPGSTYIIKEKYLTESITIFKDLVEKNTPGLIISGTFPRKLRSQHGLKDVKFMWLSTTKGKAKSFDPNRLDFEITSGVEEFIDANKGCVVLLDSIELLALANGFEKVSEFVKLVGDLIAVNDGILLVPLNPSIFNERETATLERCGEVIIVPEEEIKARLEAEYNARKAEESRLKKEAEAKKAEEDRLHAEAELKRAEEARKRIEAEAKLAEERKRYSEIEFKKLEEERKRLEFETLQKTEERKKAELELKKKEEERKKLEAELLIREEERRKIELEKKQKKALKKLSKLYRKGAIVPPQAPQVVMPAPAAAGPPGPLTPRCAICNAELAQGYDIRCECGRSYHDVCIINTTHCRFCGRGISEKLHAEITDLHKRIDDLKKICETYSVDLSIASPVIVQSKSAFEMHNYRDALEYSKESIKILDKLLDSISPIVEMQITFQSIPIINEWCDTTLKFTNKGKTAGMVEYFNLLSKNAEIQLPPQAFNFELQPDRSVELKTKLRPFQYGAVHLNFELKVRRVLDNKTRTTAVTKTIDVALLCPTCKQPLTYFGEYNSWYCKSCFNWFKV